MTTATQEGPQVFLDDISDKPPVIEEGKILRVEVAEAALKYGKESGNPYINLQIRVVDDPEDEGAVMFDILAVPLPKNDDESDKAYKRRMDRRCFRLKQAAVAFGLSLAGGKKPDELAEAFVGRRSWCRSRLGQDQRGDQRSEVDAYFKDKPVVEEKK